MNTPLGQVKENDDANVVVERVLNHPVEKVWKAITNKTQLKQWYFDLDDFKPEVGFRFSFPGQGHKGAQYTHLCTITEVVPLQKLQYSWQYEGHPGYSVVTFELTEIGNKTKLKLTHQGLETFPQDNADFAWKSFRGGWNEIIGKMLPDFLAETAKLPTVECQMMIRKPVATVFQAFIDPAITTKFWFTKSSGKLEVGKPVTWEWEMYQVSSEVQVKEIVPNQKISIEWDNTPVTTVDFEFKALTDDTTYVVIKNYGFNQTGDDLIQAIKDNTGGFTTVLDGLKAWLEFGIELNLVRDKFPNAHA